MDKPKKGGGFNILSTNHTHGVGFGSGTLDLNAISSVIIENDKAYIDLGAIHARSAVEKGIKFSPKKEDVPNGEKMWIVWIAADRNAQGPYYAGVTVCEMLIDREARRGYKLLPEHVNKMDAAMKRKYITEGLNETELNALHKLLIENNSAMYDNSPEDLKKLFSVQ